MANASHLIVSSGNAAVATTRKAAGTPTVTHDAKRVLMMLLWVLVFENPIASGERGEKVGGVHGFEPVLRPRRALGAPRAMSAASISSAAPTTKPTRSVWERLLGR
jgi:hypothetical protein